MNNLRVVVLESPYDTLSQSQQVKDLFVDLMSMRIDGFRNVLGSGMVPNDEIDYIATHVVACDEVDGKLVPLFAFKFISKDRLAEFSISYPISKWVEEEKNPADVRAAFSKHMQSSANPFYMGSLVLNPHYRATPRKLIAARNILRAAFDDIMKEYDVDECFLVAIETSYPLATYIGYNKFHESKIKLSHAEDRTGYIVRYEDDGLDKVQSLAFRNRLTISADRPAVDGSVVAA